MNNENLIFAFVLTFLAGLSTGIGSIMALLSKNFNHKFLAGALGFSAGAMIYVSLADIFPEAHRALSEIYGEKQAYYYALISFFSGIALIALIDKLVPPFENPHEIRNVDECECKNNNKLMRMGVFSAIAIGIHNFPEGMATFISTVENPGVGISIAFAIAIHNIPEGIAISAPIYYATKSRRKAFYYSILSGLSEPLGAVIAFYFLSLFYSTTFFGIILAAVAGIMVFISLDELLPTAEKYGEHHVAVYGLVSGMFVMSVSILLFM